jgi:hypothetical protein
VRGRGRLLPALFLLAIGAACLGPYQIIGEELDPTVSLGNQPTWIQATPDGTTLIVFAASDGGVTAPFTLTTIARNQSAVILAGTYYSTATTVTLANTFRYVLDNEYNLKVTERAGAERFDDDGGATYASSVDGGILTLTGISGTPSLGGFAAFPDALANLQATTQDEADCLLRVFQLTVISSETRILGFNGPSIIQYTNPAIFNGVLTGDVTINVQSLLSPNTTLTYQGFSDFAGFLLEGSQYSQTDLQGNGYISSSVAFQMTRDPGDGGPLETVVAGQVGYGNADGSPPSIILVTGTPSGGSYQLSIDGGSSFLVSYDTLNTIDVTACVSTPQP